MRIVIWADESSIIPATILQPPQGCSVTLVNGLDGIVSFTAENPDALVLVVTSTGLPAQVLRRLSDLRGSGKIQPPFIMCAHAAGRTLDSNPDEKTAFDLVLNLDELSGWPVVLAAASHQHSTDSASGRREEWLGTNTVLEAVHDGIWILSSEGTSLYANAHLFKMLGYAPGEVRSLTFESVFPASADLIAEMATANCQKGCCTRSQKMRFVRKDGSAGWAKVTLSNYCEDNLSSQSLLAMVTDISPQLEIEEQLERYRVEAQRRLDNSPNAIIRIDLEGRIVFANKTVEKFQGVERNRLLGLPVFPDDLLDTAGYAWESHFEAARTLSEDQYAELDYPGADGLVHTFDCRVIPEYDNQRTLESLLIIARDITATRQAEKESRFISQRIAEKNRFVQAVIDQLPSAVMLLSPGNRILLTNLRARELLKFDVDPVNRELSQVLPDAQGLRFLGHHRQIEIVTQDMQTLLVGYSAVPIQLEASKLESATLIVFQELGEVEKLRSALAVQERTASLGRFVAGITHELRNPLFAISSGCQILAREVTDPFHRGIISAASAEVLRVKRLMDDLLSYGNPTPPQPRLVSPWAVCDEVIGVLQSEAAHKKIGLLREPFADEYKILIDPDRVREVFLNLIQNAIQATQRGEVRVSSRRDDGQIIFEVADTGCGISSECLPHIFEPFYSRSAGGTGLGLPIVKKIIEDHFGNVVVAHTEPGQGTVMRFWFTDR